jgi:hypothetical protein
VNPVAIICTVDPTVPVVGVRAIVGGATSNVALAVLPVVSVTTTTLPVAFAVRGTMMLVDTFPLVVVVPAADANSTPLTVTLKAAPAAAKPVPDIVIAVPLSAPPIGAARLIAVVTVNAAVALLGPSLSIRVYDPAGIAGTKNQVVRLYALDPVEGTVDVPGVRVANVPPRVAVLNVDKPTTVIVTFVPAFPDAKVVVKVGAPSMVKVATALSEGVPKVRLTV